MATGLTARGAAVGRGVRGILLVFALAWLLVACGEVPETRTIRYGLVPTPDVAPTQTRAAELAQLATLTAPTSTPIATPTPLPPTATVPTTPTSTPLPLTATPEPPTSTPMPPTAVPSPAVAVSPQGGPSGTTFTFVGFNFPAGQQGLCVPMPTQTRAAPSFTVGADGSFTTSLNTTTYPAGAYSVACTIDGKTIASGSFTLTAAPATAPPTVVAIPTATVSPASGPPGTAFVFEGRDFPPGATVTWTVTSSAATSTSGNISLGAGQTSFSFTVTSDASSGGRYTTSFTVGGRQAFVVVPFAVISPAATQAKAKVLAAIDRAAPGVDKVITTCPGANTLICQAAYDTGGRDYTNLKRYLFDLLDDTWPSPCGTLIQQVFQVLDLGPNGFDSLTAPLRVSSNGGTGEAVRRATAARQALRTARALVSDRPGDCV